MSPSRLEQLKAEQRYFQEEAERMARRSVFVVAAAIRHNIPCAQVTNAMISEASERAQQMTMPRATP